MSTRKSRKKIVKESEEKKVIEISKESKDVDVIYPPVKSLGELIKEFPAGISGRKYLDDTVLAILFEEGVEE